MRDGARESSEHDVTTPWWGNRLRRANLASSAIEKIRCRSHRAARDGCEPFPKTAIYCHLLPFWSRKTATPVRTVSSWFWFWFSVLGSWSLVLGRRSSVFIPRHASEAKMSLGGKLPSSAVCPMAGESTNSQ